MNSERFMARVEIDSVPGKGPVLRCGSCGAPGAERECVLYMRDAETGEMEVSRCGAWTHGGDCFREHYTICGLPPEVARRVAQLQEKSKSQREGWHGSAGEKGTGL